MKIWLDALTPKQAILMASFLRKLLKCGYEVFLTTRRYEYTESLLRMLNTEFYSVGRHGGGSLRGKLLADITRMRILTNIVVKEKPNILIAYTSPSAFRVAFGLNIPIIALTDTPHADAVNKLTLPLARWIVISRYVGRDEIAKYVIVDSKLIEYDGVDELAWLKEFKPDSSILEKLNISRKERVIVFRPEEEKAAYYGFKANYISILKKLVDYADKIIFFPRYGSQVTRVKRVFKDRVGESIVIPTTAIDTRSLYIYSSLVVSGGATMAREAALLGTPSICYFPLELNVNKCVREWGCPLYHCRRASKVVVLAREILSNPQKYRTNTSRIIKEKESPIEAVLKILSELN